MPGKQLGITVSADESWDSQGSYVERLMDNAAYTAAHPNNTLLLAGPARWSSVGANGRAIADDLLPIGMIQSMNVAEQRPVQPAQALGSARSFFLASKGTINFSIQRLLVNGRNLLRALYTNALRSQVLNPSEFNIANFDDPPVKDDAAEQFYVNLNSELFYIPVGLGVLFRSVSHDPVGGFYIELCMLSSQNFQIAAGRPSIMESVQGIGDRILPIAPNSLTGINTAPTSQSIDSNVLGYQGDVVPNITTQ